MAMRLQSHNNKLIRDNTTFKGNVLALTSTTMNSVAVAQGRMLAINEAVVLTTTNMINTPLISSISLGLKEGISFNGVPSSFFTLTE
jgi:hypothetical protein